MASPDKLQEVSLREKPDPDTVTFEPTCAEAELNEMDAPLTANVSETESSFGLAVSPWVVVHMSHTKCQIVDGFVTCVTAFRLSCAVWMLLIGVPIFRTSTWLGKIGSTVKFGLVKFQPYAPEAYV